MLIYLSLATWDLVACGLRAVSADREGAGRSATIRNTGAHRAAIGDGMPIALWVLPSSTGDNISSPERAGQRRSRRIQTRWSVRVLPHAPSRSRRVHGRVTTADGGLR